MEREIQRKEDRARPFCAKRLYFLKNIRKGTGSISLVYWKGKPVARKKRLLWVQWQIVRKREGEERF